MRIAYQTLLLVFIASLLVAVRGAPIWEQLFGLTQPQQRSFQDNRQGRSGGNEKFKKTCWVLNPDPYAFPGQAPYPAAPLCPY